MLGVNRNQGFTLIELITSIAIMLAVASMFFMSRTFSFNRTLDAEGRVLVSDLQWTRGKAVNDRSDYCVKFDDNNYTVYQGQTCSNATKIRLQRGIVSTIFGQTTPFNLTFCSINSTNANCNYTGQQKVSDSPSANSSGVLTFKLGNGKNNRTVQIYENSGYVDLQ
jgi:prepilin-type N-terminal cleavage/methylation domain-containing protein